MDSLNFTKTNESGPPVYMMGGPLHRKEMPMCKTCHFINGETNYDAYKGNLKVNAKYASRLAIITHYLEMKNQGKELSIYDYINLVGQFVVNSTSGKMEDFYSCSSSMWMNKGCQIRASVVGSICEDCYVNAIFNARDSLVLAMETNYLILNNFDIPIEAWATLAIPTTNGKSRIESFGDADSITCARNYTNIVKSHNYLDFGLFTKTTYYAPVFREEGKPVNLIFIYSGLMLNQIPDIPSCYDGYVDHVFIVVTKEYAIENNIRINCGHYEGVTKIDHKCKNCLRCYTKGNAEFYIYELLK